MPRQRGELYMLARTWERYTDVLKEATVGNATMKDMTPAITQRTKRAIVSFTAE
jgi:hypothetical protein